MGVWPFPQCSRAGSRMLRTNHATTVERTWGKMDCKALQESALVIDSHNDTIVAHIRRGNFGLEEGPEGAAARRSGTIAFLRGDEEPRSGAAVIQINFPKMRAAGIDAAFFAIDVTLAL